MSNPNISISSVPNWCAGVKVSGLNNHQLDFTIDDILKKWADSLVYKLRSVLCVSVNADEVKLIKKLRRMGFKSAPKFMNYGHKSRKTWMMFYQVDVDLWEKTTGIKRDRNWG